MKSLEKIGFEFLKAFWRNLKLVYVKRISLETFDEITEYNVQYSDSGEYINLPLTKEDFVELLDELCCFMDYDSYDVNDYSDPFIVVSITHVFTDRPEE